MTRSSIQVSIAWPTTFSDWELGKSNFSGHQASIVRDQNRNSSRRRQRTIWWFYATPLQCVGCEPHRMEIYHFVNRAAERLNPKAPILFLTPYARSVGDC